MLFLRKCTGKKDTVTGFQSADYRTHGFLSCIGCSIQLSTKYCFLTAQFLTLCVPIPQQAGLAVMPNRLSLCFCIKQRHIFRGRRHSTTACPACWAMQTCEVKYYSEEKLFCTGRTRARLDKNLLYLHDKPHKPTMEEPLVICLLLETPFASVSTVSRGHPSLVSLL